VWMRFWAPVQTGPGAYPDSCTMGTGSFPGVKQLGSGIDHSPPSSAEVKERVELYLYSPSGPSWHVLGWTLLYWYEPTDQCCHTRSRQWWAVGETTLNIIIDYK
jgi:hypothetical protein